MLGGVLEQTIKFQLHFQATGLLLEFDRYRNNLVILVIVSMCKYYI